MEKVSKFVKLYKSLNDKPLHEQEEPKQTSNREEKVKIEIPGVDGLTDVKIKFGEATGPLEDVTITFMSEDDEVEQYAGLDFEEEEMIEDHENEGQDWIFLAKHDDAEFRVDVSVEADYDQSGNIQEVDWDSLEVEFDQETESLNEGCTEQEIAEGTCGYGIDGEIGDEPAGPHLFILEDEELNETASALEEAVAKKLKSKPLTERFQKLAGIKPLYETGMLNEIEHCDPDTGEPCTSNQTCSYQGSAYQYICVDNEERPGHTGKGIGSKKLKLRRG
tara:strand:+ start:682 stop:1512 length:831 start_codon:yes stop_codon:yes gene_type:complete